MPILIEYQPALVELDERELNSLLDMVVAGGDGGEPKLLESVTPTRERNVYSIRSGPFVGRLGLPSGRFLDFQSRFELSDSIELIRVSGRLPVRIDALPVPSDRSIGLLDVIAFAFAREVEHLAGAGLAKGYIQRRFDQPPYPGALDVTRHLGRFAGRPDRLCTHARRITRDMPVNRALLAGLEVLRRAPLSPAISVRLDRLAPVFADVVHGALAAEAIARIALPGPLARYRDALGLAEIILRSASLVPKGSNQRGAGIVYSMPKVWERYVEQKIRLAWPPEFVVEGSHSFDIAPQLRAEADVVVRKGAEIVAVYDAKYKWLDRAPAREDLYQMVTYCERLGLLEATLVYPGRATRSSLSVGKRTIHVVGLEGPTRADGLSPGAESAAANNYLRSAA